MTEKAIWFDMDGTLADFYNVENWLEYLQANDTFPYDNAKPMWNFSQLARKLNKLQSQGWKIGIISWTSKSGSDLYNGQVAIAKMCWLHKHLRSVQWDEIKIVKYGTNKYMECGGGILFDDEEKNRDSWQDKAYEPNAILPVLSDLLV